MMVFSSGPVNFLSEDEEVNFVIAKISLANHVFLFSFKPFPSTLEEEPIIYLVLLLGVGSRFGFYIYRINIT